ncbi:Tricarboxylate transporter family protein [Rhodosalinus halophilus]|uniref:Tricarboxylate transporter family protein n=1 Tax=Rhodosalinus halophilus TaxID=2259333 RepID=A0A365U5Z9_9RHOB|nr:tripartite tricarboxylate transporter permease [Rhodosalinus halophilus]RBI83771.1 Tricarboxylate transporter family protein [Rhodosalinus halophilus]
MIDLATVVAGFGDVFAPTNLLFIACGVLLGQFVGAMPGIGPVITMAIAIPFTFVMQPLAAIGFLVGINKGGSVGGAIPAILINTPGTPDAAATALDGYPMTKQGKPLKALRMALYSSITGDTFSDIVLITVAVPLAAVALKMGPVEIFALMIFAFSVIAGLLGDSVTKGLIAVALGILLASVGADPEHASPRLIFGEFELFDGLPVASVAIGALAVSEIFRRVAETRTGGRPTVHFDPKQPAEDRRVSWAEYWSCRFALMRGALFGTAIGAIPGAGSTAAAFLSYASAKQAAENPESFGKGNIKGVAATESANSAVAGADFIPLLTLGLPGSASSALLIGAFIIQGIQPGPLLFEEQGRLIYGLFGAMILANMLNFGIGLFGLRLWARIITAPAALIYATAMILCLVGAYLAAGGMIGIHVMLGAALLGYAMRSLGYPVVVFIIAFFLGPRFELSLAQTLILTDGDPRAFVGHPVALALFVLTLLVIWWMGIEVPRRARRRAARNRTSSPS